MSLFLFSFIYFSLMLSSSAVEMSTCDCWNRECGYCADLSCAVQYDLANSADGVTITSEIKRRELKSILLFNGAGNAIGMFGFSTAEIHLKGCIACNAPPAVRKAKRAQPAGPISWTVRFDGGVVRLLIAGEEVFSQELKGECAENYKDIQYFSFYEAESCEENFTLADGMVIGDGINETCGGACPEV